MRFTVHKDPAVTSEFETVYNTMQTKSHDFFNGVPPPQNVPEKGFVLALVDAQYRIYTKINGVLKYAVLT